MPRIKREKPTGFEALLDDLELLQDDDQTRLCVTAFVKLPSKKLYPDYYTLIDQPISLNEIHKKAARGQYDAASFVADFQLMYDNAVKYNDPTSWIVEDASKLLSYVKENASSVPASEPASGAAEPDLAGLCGDVLQEVIDHEFPGEGPLSGPFLANVDPDEYPDYFQLIEHPTSFSDVQEKLASGELLSEDSVAANLQRFYDATTLIFANAEQYNDPSSLIHEDSKKLRAVFDDKFNALQSSLLKKKEPVKLKLNLKKTPASPAPVDGEPPKKRRGRKPKKLIEEEQRQAALEAKLKREAAGEPDPEENPEPEEGHELLAPTELGAMGKTRTTPPSSEVFIRRVAFTSSPSVCSQVMNTLASQPVHTLSRAQITQRAMYPDVPVASAGTFFDFQFEPLGYSSKAYSVALPHDSSLVVNLKVALHELIYDIKRDDLVDGRGILKGKSEEDFMCSLFVNDEEVGGGCEITEEDDPADPDSKVLMLGYEVKMNYGLNIINFELRLSPSLSKTLKKSKVDQEAIEIAGRHTRHQLQRIKLNWDVERFTLYAVSLGA